MIFAEPENVNPAIFSKKSRENQVGNSGLRVILDSSDGFYKKNGALVKTFLSNGLHFFNLILTDQSQFLVFPQFYPLHAAVSLKNNTLIDHDGGRLNVSEDLPGGMDLDPFVREDIAPNFPADNNVGNMDI
jgi:hypothetical protein